MYRTNDTRIFLSSLIAALRHHRLVFIARIECSYQVIFRMPFATLTVSIVFGYFAAFSSVHPFLIYLFMTFLVCRYAFGLFRALYGSGIRLISLQFIGLVRKPGYKHFPMNVLFLAVLHMMSFMLTYQGIRSDIIKAEGFDKLSTENSTHELRGLVISEEKETDQYCSYIIRINDGVKVLLYTKPDTELLCGQGIEFLGDINAFPGLRNPGGFDLAKYYRSRGIFYSVFTKNNLIIISNPSVVQRIINSAFGISEKIRDDIVLFWGEVIGQDKAGFLSAVMFGIKEGMNSDVKSAMRMSNLSHLVAVSGLHISMIIAPVISLISMTGIDRNSKKAIGIVALIFLGFLTGYTPSVSRAVLMNLLSILNSATNRKNSPINNLCFSSLILLYICPYYIGNQGFTLSFSATFGIIIFSKKIEDCLIKIGVHQCCSSLLATFCAAQIGMFPTLIQMPGRQSTILVFISLVAAMPAQAICFLAFPLTVLAMIINVIATDLILAKTILLPLYFLSDILTFLSSIGQKAYYSATALRDISVFCIFGAILISAIFYCKRRRALRIIVVGVILSIFLGLFMFLSTQYQQPIATLIVADVGQGDCIILITKTRCIVIDGGDEKNGEYALLPILDYFGIYRPDLTLLTHLHRDHFVGLLEAASQDRIQYVGTPYFESSEDNILQDIQPMKAIDLFEVKAYSEVRISDAVKIQILSPIIPVENGGNEDSLVILLQALDFTALLMGDSGFATEQRIIHQYSQLFERIGEIDLLKVGHHGSKLSTSDEFLEMINLKNAVISVGKNYFGHPSEDAINRLKNAGSEIFRTDFDGAVIVYVYNNYYKIETMLE